MLHWFCEPLDLFSSLLFLLTGDYTVWIIWPFLPWGLSTEIYYLAFFSLDIKNNFMWPFTWRVQNAFISLQITVHRAHLGMMFHNRIPPCTKMFLNSWSERCFCRLSSFSTKQNSCWSYKVRGRLNEPFLSKRFKRSNKKR